MSLYNMLNRNKNIDISKLVSINIIIISNISLEPYFNLQLMEKFVTHGFYPSVYTIIFEDYNNNNHTDTFTKADYIIILLDFDTLFPDLMNQILNENKDINEVTNGILVMYDDIYHALKAKSKAKIIWFSFEDYSNQTSYVTGNIVTNYNIIDKINCLFFSNNIFEGLTHINLKKIIASVGISEAFDSRGKYRWNAPYSEKLIDALTNEIIKQLLIDKGISKKCIVIDCDNVLWGGTISEDGIENIKLGGLGKGRAYQDFQRFLIYMYNMGVILAVCSKNDLCDVINIFKSHKDMIIKEKHISCFQVNWNNKVENIKKIAQTLNIGTDSIVFIDDSLFEINAVKAMLPEVECILFDRNTIYGNLKCFNLIPRHNHQDIDKRINTYKTNSKREEIKASAINFEDYLEQLQTVVDIHEIEILELSRISELSQRTNKCTNGKRYTIDELKHRYNSSNYELYAVYVSDKFGDLGLVGVMGIENRNILDLFCLSCRALGREIEKQMIKFIKQKYSIKNILINDTTKNAELANVLKTTFNI